MLSNFRFGLLLLLALLVYAIGLNVDVMLVDAAQYAGMSWEMWDTQSFLQVRCLEQDYLDKPPLLFWLSSVSIGLFGANNIAYKLPSLLFALLGIFSTYRFAKLYADEAEARVAALMLATSQALFILCNDVRTDTMLMGAVIFSVWQLAAYIETKRWQNLIGGSVGVALALLAKGPIGLIAPAAALLPHVLLKRNWRAIFDWRWLVAVGIIALLLLPMCIGLYQQWGEKGLRFYFWTQSFGRVTGESEWNNHPDTFFLVHTTLWSFLPWTLFLLASCWQKVRLLFAQKFRLHEGQEVISLFGFTLVLAMLMLSRYQLPHYVYITFPFVAVLAAKSFRAVLSSKWLRGLQVVIAVVLLLAACFMQFSFGDFSFISLSLLLSCIGLCVFVFLRSKEVLLFSAAAALALNFLLNSFYLPALLRYQPQNDFGRYAVQQKLLPQQFVCYHEVPDFALCFYAQRKQIPHLYEPDHLLQAVRQAKRLVVFTNESYVADMVRLPVKTRVLQTRSSFRVQALSLPFLLPAKREALCRKVVLVELSER